MKELYDEYKKKVTYYLKNYNTVKSCEELRRETILESSGGFNIDMSGVRSTKKSDITASKAFLLLEQSEDALWIKIIDMVLDNFPNEFASNCIREKYNINGFKAEEVPYLHLCSRVTFQRYKKEIVIEIIKAYKKIIDTIVKQS